jgi:hypothetical protein
MLIYVIITMNRLLKVPFSNVQLILSILMLEELNKQFLVIYNFYLEKKRRKTEIVEFIMLK